MRNDLLIEIRKNRSDTAIAMGLLYPKVYRTLEALEIIKNIRDEFMNCENKNVFRFIADIRDSHKYRHMNYTSESPTSPSYITDSRLITHYKRTGTPSIIIYADEHLFKLKTVDYMVKKEFDEVYGAGIELPRLNPKECPEINTFICRYTSIDDIDKVLEYAKYLNDCDITSFTVFNARTGIWIL